MLKWWWSGVLMVKKTEMVVESAKVKKSTLIKMGFVIKPCLIKNSRVLGIFCCCFYYSLFHNFILFCLIVMIFFLNKMYLFFVWIMSLLLGSGLYLSWNYFGGIELIVVECNIETRIYEFITRLLLVLGFFFLNVVGCISDVTNSSILSFVSISTVLQWSSQDFFFT